MGEVPWEYLCFLAKGNERSIKVIERNLSKPGVIIWPENLEELTEARSKILSLLPVEQKALLDLSLLTHILVNHLSSLSSELFSWAQNSLNPASLLPDIQWDAIHGCRWQAVPVAVIQEEKSSTLFFVVGCISPATTVSAVFPAWAKDFLDEPARNNIKETLSIVRAQYPAGDRTLYLYPLRSPSGSSPRVTGCSLCLPVALGAIAALTKQAMFPELVATGDVCSKGYQVQIGAVGGVPAKANFALKEDFSFFMYPVANEPVQGLPDGLETKAVSDLDQAWRWATLYTPGQAGELNTLDTALQSAENFAAYCGMLDPSLLNGAEEKHKVAGHVDKILERPELTSQLVDQFRRCLYETKDMERAEGLGALIMPGPALEKMASVSPLNAFRWCSYNFKRANHFGELGTSFLWAENAKKFMDDARESDWDEVVSFLNSCLVNERHNCFLFQPDLPEYFQKKLDARKGMQEIKNSPDKLLGKLYGTAVQNLGFCGAACLPQLLKVAASACRAFGEGRSPDLLPDWQRQFSYLSYAYLDVHKWKEARDALWTYLGIKSWQELDFDRLFPFHHAALVRYMADTWHTTEYGPDTQGVFQRLKGVLCLKLVESRLTYEHPWQLWAYNLGRLAYFDSESGKAKFAWNKSIELCKGIAGETTRVMVLLPLAAMYDANMLNVGHAELVEDILQHIKTSKYLCKEHFNPLPNQDGTVVLSEVAKHTARFFPFTYR